MRERGRDGVEREREKEREDEQDVSKFKIFMKYKGPSVVKTLWKQNKVAKALSSKINTCFKDITIKNSVDVYILAKDRHIGHWKKERRRKSHTLPTDPSFMTNVKMSGKEWPELMVWAHWIFTLEKNCT